MRTLYRTKPELAEAFLRIVDETDTCGEIRPEHFIKVMKENQGGCAPHEKKRIEQEKGRKEWLLYN